MYAYRGGFPREDTPEDGGLERDWFDGYSIGAEQRVSVAIMDQLGATIGGVGQFHPVADQVVVDDYYDYLEERREMYVGAGYGMVDLVLPKLRISAGVRFDAYGTSARVSSCGCGDTFGSSWNPRAAAVFKPYEAGTSKVVFGKAFRAPSTYELFYNDDGATQVESPDLGAEEIWSIDIEHLHRLSKTWQAGISVYLTRTTGAIVSEVLPAIDPMDPEVFHYVNSTAPLATSGGELRLRREWAQGWMFEVSYSLQLAAYLSSDDFGALITFQKSPDHRDVANVPMQMAALKGAVPILKKALTLGTRLTFETGRATRQELVTDPPQSQTDAYLVWDLVLRGEERQSGLTYAFGVYNAFDMRYAQPVAEDFTQSTFPGQGRTFMADLGLRF